MKKLNIVICGLRFGGSFIPIYRDHPDVETVGIFDTNTALQNEVSSYYHIDRVYNSFDAILQDSRVDAVHLITPIQMHEEQSVRVLESGRHCACTVPMSITMEGIQRIAAARKKSGKNYMMMETALYTRQYLNAKQLLRNGKLGTIQLLRGCHYQDMENWPAYWRGLPPMYYSTHAMSPVAALAGSRIERVVCFGSGSMRDELHMPYGNPYPAESALMRFENGLTGEITRTLFETARVYLEGFYAYGTKASVEWGFADDDDLIMTQLHPSTHRGFETEKVQLQSPAVYSMLPESIRKYTVAEDGFDPTQPEKSLLSSAASGHHGSHPHLVHEFIRSIIENRQPVIDLDFACNIAAAGILAHESALLGGKELNIPKFEL